MIRYDYLKPASIEEAIRLLQTHGNKAMLIAGGTDVMVGIRQKKFDSTRSHISQRSARP